MTATTTGEPALAAPVEGRSASRPLARLNAVLFFAFVALLPIEWISLGSNAGAVDGSDIKPFHLASIAFVGVYLLRQRPGRTIGPVFNRFRAFYVPYTAYFVMIVFASALSPAAHFSAQTLARQLLYAVIGMFVAAYVAETIREGSAAVRSIIERTIVFALPLFVIMLFIALQQAHVDAIGAYRDAILHADPKELEYGLYRAAFRTSTAFADVGANLRHKVFGGLLVGALTSLVIASPKTMKRRTLPLLLRISVWGAFGFVILSLSRAITVALLAPTVLIGLRVLGQRRASRRGLLQVSAGVLAIVIVLLSPLGDLLIARFQDSGSYDARIGASSEALTGDLPDYILLGNQTADKVDSPHDLVLDALISAGIVAAGAAAIAMFVLIVHIYRLSVGFVADRPGWVIPVPRYWVIVAGFLAVVRFLTASHGELHQNEWVAVGLLFGAIMANERAVREQRATPDDASALSAPEPPGP